MSGMSTFNSFFNNVLIFFQTGFTRFIFIFIHFNAVESQAIFSDLGITLIFSEEKILRIIRNLNPNKAHGWDEISVRMIKMCDNSLIIPLKLIFQNCLRRGIFPETWKQPNVVPVHKKNEKNWKENYRPISLPPICSKILEKLIYESLYSHLERENLLNPNQSGFRPGDSTINQLLSITHSVFEAFDCNPRSSLCLFRHF